MAWSTGSVRRRPPSYHHGDLRQALVDATLQAIAEEGVQGVTLRGVARLAGVSHMAPYHHFPDKTALLAAAAEAGFRRLQSAMEARMRRFPAGDPRRIQAAGVAYAVFAVEHPDLFQLMFGSEFAVKREHPQLAQAADAAFACLLGALAETGLTSGQGVGATELAVTPWALVHGLATLAVSGQLPTRDPKSIERLALQATDLLGRGLANVLPPGTGA